MQFYSNQKRFSCQKCKGKKISGEKAKVNYLVKYFLSVQSFPILLTLKKCAVTSSNLKEKENLHDVTKHAEKDLQNFREALIFYFIFIFLLSALLRELGSLCWDRGYGAFESTCDAALLGSSRVGTDQSIIN